MTESLISFVTKTSNEWTNRPNTESIIGRKQQETWPTMLKTDMTSERSKHDGWLRKQGALCYSSSICKAYSQKV